MNSRWKERLLQYIKFTIMWVKRLSCYHISELLLIYKLACLRFECIMKLVSHQWLLVSSEAWRILGIILRVVFQIDLVSIQTSLWFSKKKKKKKKKFVATCKIWKSSANSRFSIRLPVHANNINLLVRSYII